MNAVAPPVGHPSVIDLQEKLAQISEHWQPHVVGALNGQEVKLTKLQGPFIWHQHNNEDELFLVLHGRLEMQFRDRSEFIDPGQFIIVPRGVEHRPVAEKEVHILLFEPAGTRNTGNVESERTVKTPVRL